MGYTELPVNFRKVDIYSTGRNYTRFSIQIETPKESGFHYSTKDIHLNVPSMFFMITNHY